MVPLEYMIGRICILSVYSGEWLEAETCSLQIQKFWPAYPLKLAKMSRNPLVFNMIAHERHRHTIGSLTIWVCTVDKLCQHLQPSPCVRVSQDEEASKGATFRRGI